MSLYNALFGVNPLAGMFLALIKKGAKDFERPRDMHVAKIDGQIVVGVLTRTGGPNRESYKTFIDKMKADPLYVADEDDSLDSTYMTFFFKIPPGRYPVLTEFRDGIGEPIDLEEFRSRVNEMLEEESNKPAPMERFRKLLEDMKSGIVSSDTVTAEAVGKKILAPILGDLEEVQHAPNIRDIEC